MQQHDILAIGDVAIDAFIRLKDAEAHCDEKGENCTLCIRFADKVPYEFAEVVYAVGNSANAAVSGSRLGLKTALSAVVGSDDNGKKCLETLKQNGVGLDLVETDQILGTNYHYVLWYGPERTILVKHEPYERHLPQISTSPKWIYLSSLGENTEAFHHDIMRYLSEHGETKLAFQPGTFQIKFGYERLIDVYAKTDIFFCNVEEAQRILRTEETDKVKLMQMMKTFGPKTVVITDGINGAYALDESGTPWFMPVYPHEPIERTGAGDAFSSTIVSCLAKGMPLPDALLWAPINAMSVTQQVGAQKGLLTEVQIKELLCKAPEDYKPKKLELVTA